jgi:hypothetical protein
MSQKSNPFAKPASDAAAHRVAQSRTETSEDASTVVESDERAEESFPVENGAVRWDDAANEGDTSREKQAVYDTPWGRRELSATEVTDFAAQGVVVTRVDDEPRTSLKDEKAELRKVELTNTSPDTSGTPSAGR